MRQLANRPGGSGKCVPTGRLVHPEAPSLLGLIGTRPARRRQIREITGYQSLSDG